ncbi:hypothetical protein Tco_1216468 [Tanacetum coccineum]
MPVIAVGITVAVMAAPAISLSADSPEESFRDTIEIGVDVTPPNARHFSYFSRIDRCDETSAIWGGNTGYAGAFARDSNVFQKL